MPYAIIPTDGTRIYYETDGVGPALLLMHSSALSLHMWQVLGYRQALRRHFRLILPDARGHGRSDKPPHAHSYSMQLLASDVLAVLDNEQICQTAFFGYSMGARIGFGLGLYAPQRFNAMVLGGGTWGPAGKVLDRATFAGATGMLIERGIGEFLEAWEEARGARLPLPVRQMYLANDHAALCAYLQATEDEPSMETALESMSMPVLLFAGSDDPVPLRESSVAARRLPDSRLVKLEGETHASAIMKHETVLNLVSGLLANVDRSMVQQISVTP
jgi:pimeloyl-ACP methyl ester carboxylesterase